MFGFLLYLHLSAAVVWIGGMFFAYVAARPAAAGLPPDERFPFWVRAFARFFPWVWAAIPALLVTGSVMVTQEASPPGAPVILMAGLGIAMMALFLHAYFAPYRRLRRAVAASDWTLAGKQLGQIRRLVGINTVLGFLVLAVGIWTITG